MSSTVIPYPNRISDRHTLVVLRTIIDHLNDVRPDVSQNTTAIAGINTQLQKLERALHSAFPAFPVLGGTGAIGASAVATTSATAVTTEAFEHGPLSRMWESGPLGSLPQNLRTTDIVWFAITDYAHIARWTGTGWQLVDAQGGYFVDAAVPLGVGYQLCDGSATDYLTVDLQVIPFITPVLAGKYFRR